MTVLFSGRLTDINIRKKAPPNLFYQIGSINFSNRLAVPGQNIFVLDRWIPTTQIQDNVDPDTGNILAHFSLALDGWNENLTEIHHATKFFTITKSTASSVDVLVTIYGNLIKASRLQVIMEWFRKGGL